MCATTAAAGMSAITIRQPNVAPRQIRLSTPESGLSRSIPCTSTALRAVGFRVEERRPASSPVFLRLRTDEPTKDAVREYDIAATELLESNSLRIQVARETKPITHSKLRATKWAPLKTPRP
jgi:hypothetical protein